MRFKPKKKKVKKKRWNSNHHYNRLQQGHGNLEVESEESDFSQESEVSIQGTESSQEQTEHLEP